MDMGLAEIMKADTARLPRKNCRDAELATQAELIVYRKAGDGDARGGAQIRVRARRATAGLNQRLREKEFLFG